MTTLAIRNGEAFARAAVPVLSPENARAAALGARDRGLRLAALFATAEPRAGAVRVHLVLAEDDAGRLHLTAFDVERRPGRWPALTPEWAQAHLFEREICEQYGLQPEGHPWLKPVRGSAPADGEDAFPPPPGHRNRLDAHVFLAAESEEMHEVAVGPVHAGIIEPGHFRFLCHGEQVEHLEISLGYQHRGVERRLVGGPDARSLVLCESVAGDTAVGHALAHCRAVEGLSGTGVSARAMVLRGVALELERCSNHVGDLGALANDVGFLPGASWFGRLRGEFLNLLLDLSGNRYGRGLVRPGGVGFDLPPDLAEAFATRLETAARDFQQIARVLFERPSVRSRFEGTGRVPRSMAETLGLVGPVARASDVARDVRRDFPHDAYRFAHLPVATAETGDVAARALVRRLETERSIAFLTEAVRALPGGAVREPGRPLRPDTGCVALAEGWRGEIVHVAFTGPDGRFARYKIVDPSFHNWTGLAMALRGQEISDFPLCNKSFNLSYAGHDL